MHLLYVSACTCSCLQVYLLYASPCTFACAALGLCGPSEVASRPCTHASSIVVGLGCTRCMALTEGYDSNYCQLKLRDGEICGWFFARLIF